MKCPCKECLVKPICRARVVRRDSDCLSLNEYLIVEFLEQCPYVREYFGINPHTEHLNHTSDQLTELCEIFKIKKRRFVWLASTIGIYK